jgi:hypothetical protein
MESGPFSTPEFQSFAADVVLFLHNTAQVDGEPYPTLLADKGMEVCSGVCIMDQDGEVIARPGREVAEFVAAQRRAQRVVALRALGEKRSASENKELFLLELGLDLVPFDALESRAARLDLNETERNLVQGKRTDGEVLALLRRMHEVGPEQTAATIAAMAKAGREPGEGTFEPFWAQTLIHAATQRDRRLAEQAFAKLATVFAGKADAERALLPFRRLLDAASIDTPPRGSQRGVTGSCR